MSQHSSKKPSGRLSGVATALVAGLLSMGAHQAANASTVSLSTPQTGAQTFINSTATSWYTFDAAGAVDGADNITDIFGYITIKTGSATLGPPQYDIFFRVYEGSPYGPTGNGDVSSITAGLLPVAEQRVDATALTFGQNWFLYQQVFQLPGLSLAPGAYTLALESDAPSSVTGYLIKAGTGTVVISAAGTPDPGPQITPGEGEVPLPASALLLGIGMLGMGAARRRQSH